MKQMPHINAALYGTPWAILPKNHAELGLLYRSYLEGKLPGMLASEGPQALEPRGERSYGVAFEVDHARGIAVLTLEGVITKRAPEMFCGPKLVDLAVLDRLLDEVAVDSGIRTVVMEWDSPGGMVIGLEETAARIRELALSKRIIAYTDFQCCSAAYYLACAADEIYAAPSAAIGSIGTYCAGLDDSRAWEMEGLELILAKSGSLKAMGHPGKAWTTEERDWLQAMADTVGAEFRGWVTSRRQGVPESTMQGQWFFAKAADASALVDGFYNDLPGLLGDLMDEAA